VKNSKCFFKKMKDLTGQAPRYLKDRILGLRLRALSEKAGYAASGGELTSRQIKSFCGSYRSII